LVKLNTSDGSFFKEALVAGDVGCSDVAITLD